MLQLRSERLNAQGAPASSSDDSESEEEQSDASESELDLDSYYFLQVWANVWTLSGYKVTDMVTVQTFEVIPD